MPMATAKIACPVPVDHGRATMPATTTARPGLITLMPQTASLHCELSRGSVASSMQAIMRGNRRQGPEPLVPLFGMAQPLALGTQGPPGVCRYSVMQGVPPNAGFATQYLGHS